MIKHAALLIVCAATVGSVAAVQLSNEHVSLRLDADDQFAVAEVVNREHGVDLLAPSTEGKTDRALWILRIRDANGVPLPLTPRDARAVSHEQTDSELTITWTGVSSDAVNSDLQVTAHIELPSASRLSFWSIAVSGKTDGVLWQVDYPRLGGIRPIGDDQMCVPLYWGRLVRDPVRRGRNLVLAYPQPLSMQFLAFWGTPDVRSLPLESEDGRGSETGWSPDRSDACGLFWGAQDGACYYKRFGIDCASETDRMSWWIENIPGLPTWPVEAGVQQSVEYRSPYRNVLGVFTGDYHEAAALYLGWARDQVWCRRGPADEWADTPPADKDALMQWTPVWFREIGFWAKFYHEPAKILPEWAAYRKWLRVPMASHYYRYHITRFNDNDPEHLPPDSYLLDGVRDARNLGVRPLPYVLSTIWDTDTQSWLRENGAASSMKAQSGEFYPWPIAGEIFAWMCPATEPWRAKMRETCRKLIWEHGMNGAYLDVLAAGGAKGCYDPGHGHSVHGGNYQGQGNRQLMADLRADIRQLEPQAAFFTEEIDEIFLDVMDGFLTLDLTRSSLGPTEQIWPVFTAVYHPYTINFGSDAALGQDPDAFALVYGLQFVWGSQPLNSSLIAALPKEGDPVSEMLRDVTQAYYVAGRRFLQGGTWRRIAVRPEGAPSGTCGLELAAARHVARYGQNRADRRRLWTGPAVMASAWERGGDLGLVMCNVTGERQQAELLVSAAPLHLPTDTRLVQTWPSPARDIGAADGSHVVTLAPRTAAVLVLTGQVARATQVTALDETPWELLTADSGPFGDVTGPPRSLWACHDGPVRNQCGSDGTVATPLYARPDGQLQRRHGFQAAVRGTKAEGHGLPRDLDRKPFLLMRRLPHVVQLQRPADVRVYSGDEHHLHCTVPGSSDLSLLHPGVLVIADAGSGEVIRGPSRLSEPSVRLPEGGPYIVGYARFSRSDLDSLAALGDEHTALALRPLVQRLIGLGDIEADQAAQELAALTELFVDVARQLTDVSGALSPVGVLAALHARLMALAGAYTGTVTELTSQHRWLSCGRSKELTFLLRNEGQRRGSVVPWSLDAIGNWRPDGLEMATDHSTAQTDTGLSILHGTATLKDGLYVERVLPLIGSTAAVKNGLRFVLTDILRLEANRPFEVEAQSAAVTVVAGRETKADIRLRNWSPDDVDVSLSASGPTGWSASIAASITAPALQNTHVKLRVVPPMSARRGAYQVRCTANHTQARDTEVYASAHVHVLDALVPLSSGVPTQAQPESDTPARIRRRGLLAIYADEGETLDILLENRRVTIYSDSLDYCLRGPDLNELTRGKVLVDQHHTVKQQAPRTGVYYLEVKPNRGSAVATVAQKRMAEVATREDPFGLFVDPITRFFYVPAGSRQFRLGARDGGPTEPARFIITTPSGRVAYDVKGNYNDTETVIDVQADEAGARWRIRVEPDQDIDFWLAGDVCPYLSHDPEGVLVTAKRQ